MKQEHRDKLKQYLMEMDPCIKFDEENEDKLIGYAERFGGAIFLMYEGINTFIINDMDKLVEHVSTYNSRALKADGFEGTLIGYLSIDGYVIYLHDREKVIEQMIAEYESDPELEEDEDYSFYTMAMENYEYNIIGAYMEGGFQHSLLWKFGNF